MTHIYISTALERRDDARRLAALLREAGHRISSTWHDRDDATRERERTLSHEDAAVIRAENIDAIDSCSVFVCIADRRCRGTLVEYQHAIESGGIRTILVGDWRDLGPMASFWDTAVDTIDDVVPAIVRKKMTTVDVAERVAAIRAAADDPTRAHVLEDQLYADVLAAVANGLCDDATECARAALVTRSIDFARWYE